jgi:hypothetical protein
MLAYLTGASNPRNAYPAFRTRFEVEKCGNSGYLVAAGAKRTSVPNIGLDVDGVTPP